MTDFTRKKVSDKYCPRFGQIAVELGYIDGEQLKLALAEQVDDELKGRHHRLLGTILFDRGWVRSDQIEQVLNCLMKQMRAEQQGAEALSACD